MKPAISLVCSLNAPLERDIAEYAGAQCRDIELWLTKLETYLEQRSVDDARRLFAEHEVNIPVASYQGGLLTSQGESRRETWGHFAKRLELCQTFGIGTLVVAADIQDPLDETVLERIHVSLLDAAKRAADHNVRIALEFQAGSRFLNNLQSTAAIIAEIGLDNLGICLDLFHYYTGPSKYEDLGLVTPQNLFHVQLSDLSGIAREFASDSDRIIPGDGDFLLVPILDHLRHIGYDGYLSMELMNPLIWQVPPENTAEIGITALRKLLGLQSRPPKD